MKTLPASRLSPGCIVSIVAAALVAGCTTVGPDFTPPAREDVQRYTSERLALEDGASGGNLAQHIEAGGRLDPDWWRLFASADLDALVRRSLEGNHTLAEARAHLAQSRELVAAEAGALSPQVAMTAGVGRQKYGVERLGDFAKPPPFTYFALGPTVSYMLDYAGGTRRAIERQEALAGYQEQEVRAAWLAVTGNAVMLALRTASLREQVAALEALLAEDRRNVRLVQTAFEAGTVSRVDVVSAESQLASDATLVPPLRQELAVARHALAIELGTAPANAAIPELDLEHIALPTTLPVSVPSELARRRPDILAAQAQLHAATAAVGVAEADLYPRITLTGSIGQQATDLGHLFDRASNAWGLAGGLVAPLVDGGTLRARKRAAVDEMQASLAHYEQTVVVAFGQVADALDALDHDREELEAQTRARDTAGTNLDLARRSYAEGNTGVLQVLDAQRAYQRAQLGYVRARGQRYVDTAQLVLALGGGDADIARAAKR